MLNTHWHKPVTTIPSVSKNISISMHFAGFMMLRLSTISIEYACNKLVKLADCGRSNKDILSSVLTDSFSACVSSEAPKADQHQEPQMLLVTH